MASLHGGHLKLEMGSVFFERTTLKRSHWDKNKGWTIKLDRSEKLKLLFLKTNEKKNDLKSFKLNWKNDRYFTERKIFGSTFKKTIVFLNKQFFRTIFKIVFVFLLNKLFYWKYDFTEWTILQNERFNWTIVQWENKRYRWKMNDHFKKERN